MITTIPPHQIPAAAGNKLYLDYIAGVEQALGFYAHAPTDFAAALHARRASDYPRQAVVQLLSEYNEGLGVSRQTHENIQSLADSDTFCVISGQQAGFVGGPAYTAFKIATSIRLAAHLEGVLGARFVPVFWLASEDHDFGEINHAHYIQRDGEIGRVSFNWQNKGQPIANLPVTQEVEETLEAFWSGMVPGPYFEETRERYAPQPGEDFCHWTARVWAELFGAHGLIIVEPRILRPPAGAFFGRALEQAQEMQHRLDDVAAALRDCGYQALLTSEAAGKLYAFDEQGNRVRIEGDEGRVADVNKHPTRYSTDAALRPLFADAMLPVVASVLGPGETAYQGMLRPLYELFEISQPLLFPRKSYTFVSGQEAERIDEYGTAARAIITEALDSDAVVQSLIPESEREMFADAERGLAQALEPLKAYVEDLDPSMGRTWEQTLGRAVRSLDKLRDRAFKARMSQMSFSKGELRRLQNALLPRGRLQERVLPLPHFMNRFGIEFVGDLLQAGELMDLNHTVVVRDADDEC